MPSPTHQRWMAETALGIAKPRSSPLKKLDVAIESYGRIKTPDSLFKIRNCFEAWKRYKDQAGGLANETTGSRLQISSAS